MNSFSGCVANGGGRNSGRRRRHRVRILRRGRHRRHNRRRTTGCVQYGAGGARSTPTVRLERRRTPPRNTEISRRARRTQNTSGVAYTSRSRGTNSLGCMAGEARNRRGGAAQGGRTCPPGNSDGPNAGDTGAEGRRRCVWSRPHAPLCSPRRRGGARTSSGRVHACRHRKATGALPRFWGEAHKGRSRGECAGGISRIAGGGAPRPTSSARQSSRTQAAFDGQRGVVSGDDAHSRTPQRSFGRPGAGHVSRDSCRRRLRRLGMGRRRP